MDRFWNVEMYKSQNELNNLCTNECCLFSFFWCYLVLLVANLLAYGDQLVDIIHHQYWKPSVYWGYHYKSTPFFLTVYWGVLHIPQNLYTFRSVNHISYILFYSVQESLISFTRIPLKWHCMLLTNDILMCSSPR